MNTHTFTPFALRDGLAGRTQDELAYVALAEITYGDKGAQRRAVVESVPWTLDAIRSRGVPIEDGASIATQADAMVLVVQAIAAANTLAGAREWEAAVYAPKGAQRLVSRRFRCEVYGGVSPDGGQEDGFLTPPDDSGTLETADAMAAAPGLRAVTGGIQRLVELTDRGVGFALRHMQTAEVMWQRQVQILEGIIAELRQENAALRQRITELTDLLLEDDVAPPVPPEIVRDAAHELGSNLKMALAHWMGTSTGLLDTLKAMPDDVCQALAQPSVQRALQKPEVIDTFRHILSNLPESP